MKSGDYAVVTAYLLMRFVVLICECRPRWTPDHNKRVLGALMASVAGGRKLVVAGGEGDVILRLNRLFQTRDLFGDDCVEHVGERQVLESGHEVLHVAHNFLDFTELVFRKRPIARLGGKPQLVVLN